MLEGGQAGARILGETAKIKRQTSFSCEQAHGSVVYQSEGEKEKRQTIMSR